MVNDNSGFWALGGQFHTANFPAGDPASPPVDQLLGVNDSGVAVGFWTDANGNNHGYQVNVNTSTFSPVTDPNAPGASLTAAAINNSGDIAGFYTSQPAGTPTASSWRAARSSTWPCPARPATMAFGVNGNDQVVGAYTAGAAARQRTGSAGRSAAASRPSMTRTAWAPPRSTA